MELSMKIKIAISLIVLLGIFIVVPVDLKNQTNASMFCSYGRVFVQFEERHNIWGVMWLDENGKPVSCDNDGPITKSTEKTRETI